jgi:hypothetical protein
LDFGNNSKRIRDMGEQGDWARRRGISQGEQDYWGRRLDIPTGQQTYRALKVKLILLVTNDQKT